MKRVIVLAVHGAPPNDFPRHETAELFSLDGRLHGPPGPDREAVQRRYAELDAKVRAWPRTAQNDPFWAASHELAAELGRAAGAEVVVGFNEFCAPGLDEALDEALARGVGQVVVVTPMMTRGGDHAERDIPAAIRRAQQRRPEVAIVYAWPFDPAAIGRFMAEQIEQLQPQG